MGCAFPARGQWRQAPPHHAHSTEMAPGEERRAPAKEKGYSLRQSQVTAAPVGAAGRFCHQCVTGIQFSDAGMFALLARSLGYVVYIKFSIWLLYAINWRSVAWILET